MQPTIFGGNQATWGRAISVVMVWSALDTSAPVHDTPTPLHLGEPLTIHKYSVPRQQSGPIRVSLLVWLSRREIISQSPWGIIFSAKFHNPGATTTMRGGSERCNVTPGLDVKMRGEGGLRLYTVTRSPRPGKKHVIVPNGSLPVALDMDIDRLCAELNVIFSRRHTILLLHSTATVTKTIPLVFDPGRRQATSSKPNNASWRKNSHMP